MYRQKHPRVIATGVNRHGNIWEKLDFGPDSPNQNAFRYINNDGSTYISKADGWKEFDTGRGRVIDYAPDNWEDTPSDGSASPPNSPTQDMKVKREALEEIVAKQEPLECLIAKQEEVEMPLVKVEDDDGQMPIRARSWSRCPLSNRLERCHL